MASWICVETLFQFALANRRARGRPGTGVFDGAGDAIDLQRLHLRNAVHDEQLRTIDVIGRQLRVRRAARQASLLPMHSSASRATEATSSVSPACVAPNRRLMWSARNEPSASDANPGTVITARPSNALLLATSVTSE